MRAESIVGIHPVNQNATTNVVDEQPFSVGKLILFGLFNVLLAYLSKQSALFSTFYGWSILLIGLFYLVHDKKPTRIIYLCGYVVGAELIWRSTGSGVFYEYGKYAIIGLFSLALLKFSLLNRATKWPVLYFVLLLPSVLLLPHFDRATISFFLSGPLMLAVSTMFFSTMPLTQLQVKNLLIAIIAPTIGIAFLATYSTITATELAFTTESNFTTSGGFGPVQMSLQLAFGALLAFYYAIIEKKDRLLVLFMFGISAWLMSQSIFTFSRSGLYNAGVTLLMFLLFYLRQGRQRTRLVLFGGILVLFMVQVAFPWMDRFTNGMLALRYQETTTAGRGILAKADWQAFLENPFLGVGPGQSIHYHIRFGLGTSSHTEYTRLLSEHGSFGLLSMLILVMLVMKRVFGKTSSSGKSFQILMTVWALLYMLNTTMRTASPGFAFGLGAVMLMLDERGDVENAEHTTGR